MSSWTARCPAAQRDNINATLEGLGRGPNNFSIALRPQGGGSITHYAMHHFANDPALLAVVDSLPSVQVDEAPDLTVQFANHIANANLEING